MEEASVLLDTGEGTVTLSDKMVPPPDATTALEDEAIVLEGGTITLEGEILEGEIIAPVDDTPEEGTFITAEDLSDPCQLHCRGMGSSGNTNAITRQVSNTHLLSI
jgi:hypothetical protein